MKGRPVFEDEEEAQEEPRSLPARGFGLALLGERARWLVAMRWRRRVERALKPLGLTFTQWLVLESTRRAIFEAGDAVSQNDVARTAELNRATISQVMLALQEKGLVDRGAGARGCALRVLVSRAGSLLLDQCGARLEAASRWP